MKKRKDNKKIGIILVAVFITLTMVFSIFEIAMNRDTSDSLEYGKYKFTQTETGYKTSINGKVLTFFYFPSEVERINLSSDIKTQLKTAKFIVILFNPNETDQDLVYFDEVRYELETQMNVPTYSAMTQESEKYNSIPILGCENATQETPFLILNSSNTASFNIDSKNSNCIYINGKLKEALAAKDRLVYGMYDIILK